MSDNFKILNIGKGKKAMIDMRDSATNMDVKP